MPTIMADRLQTIAEGLLQGAGVNPEEAGITARHCVGANLAGHDSHGIIQIPRYIEQVKQGHIVPGARLEVVQEAAVRAVKAPPVGVRRAMPSGFSGGVDQMSNEDHFRWVNENVIVSI